MTSGARTPPPDDLAAFYADQFDRVRATLVLFTGDRQLGEELAQEAFVQTCQHWERVRTMEAPGAWVHRVGINLAISQGRRRTLERRPRRRLRAESASVAAIDATGELDPTVRAALMGLSVDDRSVVVLRFCADLSVAQVAQALDLPEGTVKTRTRHALAALRGSGLMGETTSLDGDELAEHDVPGSIR